MICFFCLLFLKPRSQEWGFFFLILILTVQLISSIFSYTRVALNSYCFWLFSKPVYFVKVTILQGGYKWKISQQTHQFVDDDAFLSNSHNRDCVTLFSYPWITESSLCLNNWMNENGCKAQSDWLLIARKSCHTYNDVQTEWYILEEMVNVKVWW